MDLASQLAESFRQAIFVDQVIYSVEEKEDILSLLREHITESIVKVGQSLCVPMYSR
jgi:hypothetical protein